MTAPNENRNKIENQAKRRDLFASIPSNDCTGKIHYGEWMGPPSVTHLSSLPCVLMKFTCQSRSTALHLPSSSRQPKEADPSWIFHLFSGTNHAALLEIEWSCNQNLIRIRSRASASPEPRKRALLGQELISEYGGRRR
jgi:hypothetical protein